MIRQRFLNIQTFTTLSGVTGTLNEHKVYKVSIDTTTHQSRLKKLYFQKPDGGTCDEKNGWFNLGVDAKLREILTKQIKQVILAETKIEDDQDAEDEWQKYHQCILSLQASDKRFKKIFKFQYFLI